MDVIELETPHGPARAHLSRVDDPVATLVLGHGAGGGVHAPDLEAARLAARGRGWTVALVEQPYRVAGRRSSPPTAHLDAAWIAVVSHLQAVLGPLVVTGGRSAGARVACRTAEATSAAGVLCLAFPLQPPARAGKELGPSRLPELDAVTVETLVVQGERDRFGIPPPGPHREVVVIRGDHGLKTDLPALAEAVGRWIARIAS